MANLINSASFEATGELHERSGYPLGTVEVTLGRETKRVPAWKDRNGCIAVLHGIGGRYRTGTGKIWRVSLSQHKHPTTGEILESCWFGRDDRSGKFNKNGIFFTDEV
ncbi:hypothetical protein [Burkholderia cenocepacia]|uniref:hypothetical protein n=1 Tax=Burkholderia cenocepacia TaxID=95486 RepID=UPI000F5AAB14|nr:hypothetical protein [Burkholderia cenocepacia]RQU83915.1 hypothetical protein DF040_33875 [Burkholderia cenocepacia]